MAVLRIPASAARHRSRKIAAIRASASLAAPAFSRTRPHRRGKLLPCCRAGRPARRDRLRVRRPPIGLHIHRRARVWFAVPPLRAAAAYSEFPRPSILHALAVYRHRQPPPSPPQPAQDRRAQDTARRASAAAALPAAPAPTKDRAGPELTS